MVVYQCEGSPECILTAIYRTYEEKCDHKDTRISLTEEPFLFAEYRSVTAEEEKAKKVFRTLKRRFGEEDLRKITLCLASSCEDRGQAIYQTVVKGLESGCRPGHLFDGLADPEVHKAFVLARGAENELHHLYGFLRFQEWERGVLYARIGPKNDLTSFLMSHFADRLPEENFMIHDEHRNLFGIHPVGGKWFLLRDAERFWRTGKDAGQPGRPWKGEAVSAGEEEIQELFRLFCHTIAIEERWNPQLQRNLLPLRFREYMTEF